MLFNSLQFLIFLPVVIMLYYALSHPYRWLLVLIASCYFYMVFRPIYILILFFTIVIDYFAGIYIDKSVGKRRRLYLIMSLVANIGVLMVFKYYNFFAGEVNKLILPSYELKLLNILLPIGLSFHTFQAMSYTVEIYRGNFKPERHFGYYSLYVMYFPQLVAGPIERPQNILQQLKEPKTFRYESFSRGVKMILYGLFKKVVIADNISAIVDAYYGTASPVGNSILYVLLFSIQIYCDFSGYSDIAIGSSELMGIELMKNFRFPYFSRSIGEFWQRWHISLSTWFRDYVYIPLGGSRTVALKHYRNILIVFGLSGLWHGANWTFIVWGIMYGILLILENIVKPRAGWLTGVITFAIVSVLWIFFRSPDFHISFLVFRNLFSTQFNAVHLSTSNLFYIGLTALFFLFEYYIRNKGFDVFINGLSYPKRVAFLVAMIYVIVLLGVFDKNQFIYFQF